MNAMSSAELQRKLLELDDKLEELVMSLDESEPDRHAGIYAEMEAIHEQIFALKAMIKQHPGN